MAGILLLEDEWDRQPQRLVTPNTDIIPPLSHLWMPCGLGKGMLDIAGGFHALDQNYASNAVGKDLICSQGTGQTGLWGEIGTCTASGFGNDWATWNSAVVADHTVFALVEFDSLSSSSEFSVLRIDAANGNYMLALDVFPSTKTVRPLVATYPTSGWTVNNDKTHAEIVVNTPLIVAYRYTSGSPIESMVAPIGGAMTWTKTSTNVAGGIRQNNTNSLYAHIGGFGNNGGATSFPGKIYTVGMVPYAIPNHVFRKIIDNPWIVCAP